MGSLPPIPAVPSRKKRFTSWLQGRFWRRLLAVALVWATPWQEPSAAAAANPSGGLRIRIRTAPNFVVDSNVETPATYAPRAAYIGARVCNESASEFENVHLHVGDFDPNGDSDGSDSTPGVYPVTSITADLGWGYSGDFALRHQGGRLGTADAKRHIERLAPGECASQWWLVSYPRMDSEQVSDLDWNDGEVGNAVWGAANNPNDDLRLEYDVWATGQPVGGVEVTAWDTRSATLRNEISAKANKIWPNTLSKVPEAYLNLTAAPLGWNILESGGVSGVLPGDTFTMAGIWYDFGVVGQGFDNDGDLVPDYNAWMQPVGDPTYFDPGCFRPVSMRGILIVKLIDGTEQVIPFKDDLYFERLPANNNGVVGLVYYTFMALDAPCSSSLSPYQEVASGSDNEKFNGDFGALTGEPLSSPDPPTASLNKTVSPGTVYPLPGVATWTLSFTNTSATAIGNPNFDYPLVIRDSIPSGTAFRSGTAASSVSGGARVWYSTNGGVTWLPEEPVPASGVTHLEWRLNETLAPGGNGWVSFQSDIPGGYMGAVIPNTATLRVGDALPIATATTTALVGGTREVGDTVFRDTAPGASGNGVQDVGEPGLAGVAVRLYFDANADGLLDDGDLLMGSQTTDANGTYLFSGLPASRWIVVVDSASAGVPTGYGLSTPETFAANTTSESVLSADFGFTPALGLSKQLLGSGSAYEGHEVRFKVDLWNQLRSAGGASLGAVPGCSYDAYPTAVTSANFTDPTFALGAPQLTFATGTYATTTFVPGKESLEVEQFAIAGGAPTSHLILNVDAVAYLRRKQGDVFSNDAMNLFVRRNGSALDSLTFSPAQLNTIATNAFTEILWNITDAANWDWPSLALSTGNHLAMLANKSGAADGTLYLDALGLRITTDCGGDIAGAYDPRRSLDPVRLVDTYDPARMEFVSASRPPTSVNSTTGEIVWEGLGPINPAGSMSIVVVFRLKALSGNVAESTSNTATVSSAFFADGRPANTPADDAAVSVLPTGSIAGYVWSDTVGPANGWQGTTGYQTGEPLVGGVSVELLQCTVVNNSGGCDAFVVIDRTVTGSDGYYQFTGLIPGGRYATRVVTTSFVGNPAPVQTGDPDDDAARGSTGNGGTCGGGGGNEACDSLWNDGLTLVLGTSTYGTADPYNYTQINFGYTLAAALFGSVWRDADADGTWDEGEPALSGVSVCLDTNNDGSCSGEVSTATTDADGRYVFTGLAAGTYRVAVHTGSGALTGATQTGDPDEAGRCVLCDGRTTSGMSLIAGDLLGPSNFGFVVPGTSSIGDVVYLDNDGNGSRGAFDPGIAGVTLRLYYDANGNASFDPAVDLLVGTTATGTDGAYLFPDLSAGTYFVTLDETTLPGSYAQTDDPDSLGACSGTACDARSAAVVLATSQNRDDVDFGYRPPSDGFVGDMVFHDRDGNGVPNGAFESGIDGITVWLCPGGVTACDGTTAIATTVTSGGGIYGFTGLNDGPYKIALDLADADLPTDYSGSDFVPTTPVEHSVLLVNGLANALDGSGCGACNLDADFGLVGRGSIGDFIFYDTNQNGTQDIGEPGIPGVRLFLCAAAAPTCDAGSALATVWSSNGGDGNAPGAYQFHQLAPGSYQVAVDASTLPSGLTAAHLTSDPDADGVPCSALSPTTEPPSSVCDGVTGSGSYRDISLGYGAVYSGADFGYAPSGVIGDFVWLDLDQDGVQDAGEQGVGNVRIWLDGANPGVLDWVDGDGDGAWDAGEGERWARTDPDGRYYFENVPDGTVTVAIEVPAERAVSADGDALHDGRVTVQLSGGAVTGIGGAACGSCDLAVDFGLKLNGAYSYSGNVCLDDPLLDGACTDAAGESDLAGMVVYLYDATNRLVGSTVTGADGAYLFSGLPNGTYRAVMGTAVIPLNIATVTTSGPSVTVNTYSVVQSASIAGSSVTDVDFAFELDVAMDFGDLPAAYRTTLSADGARHEIPPGGVTRWLGALAPDAEFDAVVPLDGTGDGSDEDGVLAIEPSRWIAGTAGGSLTVQAGGAAGWLVGWMDFNRDGDFLDAGELVLNQAVGAAGSASVPLNIPAGAFTSPVVSFPSRFRILSEAPEVAAVAYLGLRVDGEVEDHVFVAGRSNAITGTVALEAGTPGFGGDIGIGGVRIDLYRDSNGDGVVGPGDLVATTTTDESGSYTFSGLPNETYLVVETDPDGAVDVTDRDGDLGGNGFDRIRVVLRGADSVANDFLETGLTPGSIAGTVYDDNGTGVAGDGAFGADAGVPSVVVTLYLDMNGDGVAQAGEAVATTTTDSNGAYLFENLAAGAYLVVETDPLGLVSITDAGEPDATNDDNTIAVVVAGTAITGRDFLDDAAPMANRDYGDLPDTGPGTGVGNHATLATDAGPSHLVYAGSGFRLGALIDAETDGQPSNLASGGDAATGSDDEDGVSFPASPKVGTTIQLTVNLGALPVEITPRLNVWFDFNADGDLTDAGEQVVTDLANLVTGNNSVSVALPETAVVGTAIGVRVRLADAPGVASTGEAGYGEVEDYLVILEPLPTAAIVTAAWAIRHGAQIQVGWRTGYEEGAVAFRVLTRGPGDGAWTPLSDSWVPAARRILGAEYTLSGDLTDFQGRVTVGVLELQSDGSERLHGPFELHLGAPPEPESVVAVGEDPGGVPAAASATTWAASAGAATAPPAADGSASKRTTSAHGPGTVSVPAPVRDMPGPARHPAAYARFETETAGLHHVTAEELALATGRRRELLQALIRGGSLALSEAGTTVGYVSDPTGEGFYFHAEAPAGMETRTRVFWLSGGRNPVTEPVGAGIDLPVGQGGTLEHRGELRVEQDLELVRTLTADPSEDYWVWDALVPGNPLFSRRTYAFRLSDLNPSLPSAPATLEFELVGGDEGSRRVIAELQTASGAAGATVGEVTWSGRGRARLEATFASHHLVHGLNRIALRAVAVEGTRPGGLVYTDAYRLAYPALRTATGGLQEFRTEDDAWMGAAGFLSPHIAVLDVTKAARPRVVLAASVEPMGSRYAVRFAGQAGHRYAVFEPGSTRPVLRLQGVGEPLLSRATNRADYLVIAPDALRSGAEDLARLREAQGLASRVVSLTEIANEFGHGVPTPGAMAGFVRVARRAWSLPPRYLVLVGNGTPDYRDLLKAHDNLLPVAMAPTRHGLVASDSGLADARLSVGRLPVVHADQLAAVIAKIREHESRLDSARPAALVGADLDDGGGTFTAHARELGAILATGYRVRVAARGEGLDRGGLRRELLSGLSEDLDLLVYSGHGAPDRLGAGGYLTAADVAALGNEGRRLPVVVALTCLAGDFGIPGADSLAERLILEPARGAIAVLAPTGLSEDRQAQELGRRFVGGIASIGTGERLGDALRAAASECRASDGSTDALTLFNLVGDPALRVRPATPADVGAVNSLEGKP